MQQFAIPEDELRAQAETDGITHLVSGVAVVQDGKVLVLRRAADDFMGGLFELPGGGVEDGETLQQAVVREIAEEAGLNVTAILGMFPGFDYTTPTKPSVRQFNFLVSVQDPKQVKLSDEHDQSLWINVSDVDTLEASDEMKQCFRDALEVAVDLVDV